MPEPFWSGKLETPRGTLLVAACLTVTWFSQARADCAPEPQGQGRVVAALDARTLRFDDGRVVRLSGLAPLRDDVASKARAELARIAVGQQASLHGASDTPDRYGRQRAWVFLENADISVQAALVRAGAGLRDVPLSEPECRAELESAEKAAQAAGLGIWVASGPTKKAEVPDDISAEIGHFRVIEGRVRTVRASGGVTYLNFGRRWSEGFAVMVPKRAEKAFETAGLPLKSLEGRQLRARGYIVRRQGPRIEALGPEQIEVVGGGAVTAKGTQD